MTLTVPLVLEPDEHCSSPWSPMLSSQAPGIAAAVSMPDRLRLVVLERAGRPGAGAKVVREVLRSATVMTAAELADQLAVGPIGRPSYTSVAIADLLPDGSLELQVRAAPPALLFSPGQQARLLPGACSGPGATTERLNAGDVLVLCSASFLEDPPGVLGTVRRSPAEGTRLTHLRQVLRESGHPGATASVAVPSTAQPCA